MPRLALLILLTLPALLPALPAGAETLKFSTWNLEWLTDRPAGDPALPADVRPKQPQDVALLRGYAALLAADVVAFQEVDGPAAAAGVFPSDRYALHLTADPVVQRVGLAVRRGIPFTANPDLAALDVTPDARFRLRSGADITLATAAGRLRVLAVHLKTGCRQQKLTAADRPACALLRAQLAPLQAWIAARGAEHMPFVILGDFNRWMDGRDAFWAGLAATAPLVRATAGHSSNCWGGGGFIDHIIAGGAAGAWMRPDSLRVLVYRETAAAWKDRLSDHCPVSVRFELP